MDLKFVLVSSLEVIEKRFSAKSSPAVVEIPKSYLIGRGDPSYVITDPNSIHVFKYGLTPHYAQEPLSIMTARAEGTKNKADDPGYSGSKAIFLLPEFKKSIFSQRCIVVADAYYAWSDKNQQYLVYLQQKKRPFGFAGLYDTWQHPETRELTTSFAIIATTANEMLQGIGVKRMPVILPLHYETNWLKSSLHLSEILSFLDPFPSKKMNAYPVNGVVNHEVNDVSLLTPRGDKLQVEVNPPILSRSHHYHKSKPVSNTPWFKSAE